MASEAKLNVLIAIKDGASKGLQALNKQLTETKKEAEKTKEAWGALAKASAVMGASIVGSFGMMAKAAEGERISVAKLSNMLKNVGVAYDDVKDSLEANIRATQRKTGIADDQQREALSQLLMVTGNYKKSLDALPAVLDLAAARGMDVASAAVTMGRALNGDTTILKRYGIAVKDGANATEVLAAITEACGGSAEAMASPFAILQAELGDMAEAIGGLLLPALSGLVRIISGAVGGVTDFIGKTGTFGTVLTTMVGIVGVLALALAAYAAAQESATFAQLGHVAATIAGTVASIAKSVATVGLTATVTAYATALWAAVAAELAALAPLALVGAAFLAVGAAVAGVIAGIGWLISKVNESSQATNEYTTALNTLQGQMDFYKGKIEETKTKIGEEQAKLKELEAELDYVKTYMIDAFGVSRLEEINNLKAALETQKGTIEGLETAIGDAKRELEGFLNPKLEGMNAADSEIGRISGNIDVLNLKKLLIQAKADTTEVDTKLAALDLADVDFTVTANMEGIDSAIAKEQQAYDIAVLTRDVTFEPLVTQINNAAEAALGMNTEMAPETILARILQLTTDINTNQTALEGVQTAAGVTQSALTTLEQSVQTNIDAANKKVEEQKGLIADLEAAARAYAGALGAAETQWNDIKAAADRATAAARAARAESYGVASWSVMNPSNPNYVYRAGMATGGIVTQPTNALIGEAGPEAVIPLSRGGFGSTYNITISAGAFVGDRAGADTFADLILDSLRTKQRYSYGAAQF
jgi:hypothetical protein